LKLNFASFFILVLVKAQAFVLESFLLNFTWVFFYT